MKLKYKSSAKLLLLASIAFVMVQCNEDVDRLETGGDIVIGDSIPAGLYGVEVSDVTVTSGERSLDVSWTAPDAPDLGYYIVEWVGQTPDTMIYSEIVSGGATETTLTGLYNTSYVVTVKTMSVKYQKSAGVQATGTPDEDLEGPGTADVQVTPLASSALLVWGLPEEDDFDHSLVTIQKIGVDTLLFQDTLSNIESLFLATGLEEATEYEYTVIMVDYIGNKSEATVGTLKTLKEQNIDKKDPAAFWEVLDWSDESSGEGATGKAKDAIDSNEETYWHNKWESGAPAPHWIIIDLKKPQNVSVVDVFTRKGRSANKIIKVEGYTGPDAPTGKTEWVEMGEFTFVENLDKKSCSIVGVIPVQYLKINIMIGNAMVRNVDVRALVSD